MELKCAVQEYAWGKTGLESAVASLRASADEDFKVSDSTPYAELWMGTHPNGPSKCLQTMTDLKKYIQENPNQLGKWSRDTFGDDLPFLFKVLSVNKALSIQAHPNKKHAEELHADRPQIYKDPNHKPEMAIALTAFEGLCGFRPLSEIKLFLESIPELTLLIGKQIAQSLLESDDGNHSKQLREAFSALMKVGKDDLNANLKSLEARIIKKTDKTQTDELFLKLIKQYPGDVGCFVIFFVNHLKLQPGEAMYLGPNLIHAYLSGDCIECMACSDNVVRAGLTPKLIDVPTLVSMLEYKCCPGENMKFKPTVVDEVSIEYNPPVPDFAVMKHTIKSGQGEGGVVLPIKKSASIVLVTEGSGHCFVKDVCSNRPFRRGTVLFLGSDEEMKVVNTTSKDTVLFQAFC